MEDEYVCVDNLREHLDAQPDNALHGAFYGVTIFDLQLFIWLNAGNSIVLPFI